MEEAAAWRAALEDVPHSFHHSWEHANAIRLSTGDPVFMLELEDDSGRVLRCPLIERELAGTGDVASVSGLGGLVGDASWPEIREGWSEYADEQGWVSAYVGVHPLFEPQGLPLDPPHNSIYVLRLERGREALLQRMDQNRRRELRGWEERAALLVTEPDAIADFLGRSYEPFMKAVGARPPYLSADALRALCASRDCIAVGAGPADDLQAACLFGVTAHAADWLLGVATPEGRARTTDLVWHAVTILERRGVPILSLGGGAREGDRIAEAKQRFGPERLGIRALRQVFDGTTYARMCDLAGVDAADEGFFPAYRAPSARPIAEGAA